MIPRDEDGYDGDGLGVFRGLAFVCGVYLVVGLVLWVARAI